MIDLGKVYPKFHPDLMLRKSHGTEKQAPSEESATPPEEAQKFASVGIKDQE